MRFTSLLPLLTLALGFTASPSLAKSTPKRDLATRTTPKAPISPRANPAGKFNTPAEKRQAVELTVCATVGANVGLQVLGQTIGLGEDLCLCLIGGVLSPDSLAQIDLNLRDRTALLVALLGINIDAIITAVEDALVVLLGTPAYDDGCDFPPNSIPDGCGVCTFECAEGFTFCDGQCLPNGSCPSSRVIPRRRIRSLNPNLLCAKGLTACGVAAPGKNHLLVRGKVECLDTTSNVETCGGCPHPLFGKPTGVDCTAIDHAEVVSCVLGKCIVNTCEKGFYVGTNGLCLALGVGAGADVVADVGTGLGKLLKVGTDAGVVGGLTIA